MAHWRTMLTREEFSAADLWSEKADKYVEIDVQIDSVRKGEVVGEKGRKKGMPFITMRSAKTGQLIPKPFGCNATNGETIAAIVGSPDAKKWPGTWITLYVTRTEMGKGMRDCIRIRPESPKRDTKPANTSPEQSSDRDTKPDSGDLTDADKRAIEMAEREEASHG